MKTDSRLSDSETFPAFVEGSADFRLIWSKDRPSFEFEYALLTRVGEVGGSLQSDSSSAPSPELADFALALSNRFTLHTFCGGG